MAAQVVTAPFLLALMDTQKAMPYEPFADAIVWSLPKISAVGLSGIFYAVAIFGQHDSVGTDWANLGVVGVITALFAYIITKRDPHIQEKNNELLKHMADQFTNTIAKMEEENSITLKSIVMDHKEILKDTVEKLVNEKRSMREGMQAHSEKQLERVIQHYDLQLNRFIDVLREDDNGKAVRAGNSKGGGT